MLLPSKRMSAKGESWFLSNGEGKTTFTLTATTPNWPSSVSYNIIAGSKKRFPLRAIVLLLFYTSARPISCCVGSGPKWCSSSWGRRPDFFKNKNEFLFSIPFRERERIKSKSADLVQSLSLCYQHTRDDDGIYIICKLELCKERITSPICIDIHHEYVCHQSKL